MDPRDTTARIGYIGLGHMGGALARRLLLTHPLTVHDRSVAARESLVGARPVDTPAAVAARSDVVLLCLPTSDHVETVLFGEDGVAAAAAPGTLIVDQTTGDPGATRRFAARLAQRDLLLVDAPVSGGPTGAEAGTIAIMVGADDATFARLHPVLAAISPNVFHAGTVGAGHVIKLANNLLSHTQRLLSLEALALVAKNGVDPATALEILVSGGGRNAYLERRMGPVIRGELGVGFTLGLAHKDVRLACQIGVDAEVPMFFGNLARDSYAVLMSELGRDTEVDEAARVVDRVAGTRVVASAGREDGGVPQ